MYTGELFMVLTDNKILELSKANIITPFDERYLQSESYDLHIGDKVYCLDSSKTYIDLQDDNNLTGMYVEYPLKSTGMMLSPKQFVLVSLKETILLPDTITAHIRPRTRFTRAGLYVSSQHCNSSYNGQLRIGLYNFQDRPIKIYPHIGICQIVFEELDGTPSEARLYKNKKTAQYQNEQDFRGPAADPVVNELLESYLKSI